jgi:hypothetical protein
MAAPEAAALMPPQSRGGSRPFKARFRVRVLVHLLEVGVVYVCVDPKQSLEYGADGLPEIWREGGPELGGEHPAVVDLEGGDDDGAAGSAMGVRGHESALAGRKLAARRPPCPCVTVRDA